MKITDISTFLVPPRWLFLRIATNEGITGWGEPVVEGRAETVRAAVHEVSDLLIGADPLRIEDHWQVLTRGGFYRGGPVLSSAVAGIDQALWDIAGKAYGAPVYRLLGGPVRDRARVYAWIGGDEPEQVADQAREQVEAGFTAVKMNAAGRMEPIETLTGTRAVLDRVAAVRDAIGPDRDFVVDFHGRASTAMSRRLLPLLEPLSPLFVEEPSLPEYSRDLSRLTRHTTVPIATGERLYSRWDFRDVLTTGIAVVQPDVSHAGGISEVRRIAALAEAHDVSLAPHCPLGPIALAASLQLAFATPNFLIEEQSIGIHYNQGGELLDYLMDPSVFRFTDGYAAPAAGPGLGVEIDEAAVRRAELRRAPLAEPGLAGTRRRLPGVVMNLLDELRSRRLLAIVRGADPGAAARSVAALAEAGVGLIEVSLTTPDAFGVISRARAETGAAVGAGTVVTARDAIRAAEAGAGFIVTPAVVPAVATVAELGLPVLCGALTPTEVVAAREHGAVAVKLFPASLGGARYLRALRDPFPAVPFVPVGGVDADAAREYLAAGAVAVGVGSPLLGDAASGGSLTGLRARARRFLAVAAADGAAGTAGSAAQAGGRRSRERAVTAAPQVVTFGETMAAMRGGGPLRLGGTLRLSVAGAESNVAIGLARLGHTVAWAGRVGDDEPGALVLRTLRAENVDIGGAVTDPARPTGLILVERRTPDVNRVQYYRSGSAGGALEPGKPLIPNGSRFLHITGITPALGQNAARAVLSAAERAREAGLAVSFDVNYRSRLRSPDDARAALRPLASMAAVVFGSAPELSLLTDAPAGDAAADGARDAAGLLERGARAVVVKRGARGATAYTTGGAVSVPARAVRAVDVIGAGDAFVAGYLSGALDGLDTTSRLRRGAAVSAFAVGSAGDWEGLPTRRELSLLDAEEETIR